MIGGMSVIAAQLAIAGLVDLDGRPRYLHSGWFLISVGNLVVILAMIGVFALAIVLPFPRDRKRP